YLDVDGIVPCRTRYANVIRDNSYAGIDRPRTFFITDFELVEQRNIHAAEKSDRAGFRSHGGDHPDKIGALVLFEDQRCDVRQPDDAIDDCEVQIRIILRHGLDGWSLVEADSDDEIVTAFRKGAYCRL